MPRWPISRRWQVVSPVLMQADVVTVDLKKWRACSLLGSAGLGKTYELDQMADEYTAAGM